MILRAMMNDKISELDATLLATHRDEWEPTQALKIIIVSARSLRVCGAEAEETIRNIE